MKPTYAFLCLLFILLLSCSSESEDKQGEFRVIPVDTDATNELSIDDIAQEVAAVKFEETDESLITFVAKVERTKDYIFVFDSGGRKVLQFNSTGEFIRTIGKTGEGPEEVTMPTTFVLDRNKGHVYIGGMRKVVVYDFDGNFVRYLSGFSIPNYMYFNDEILEIFRTETKNLEEGGSLKFPTRYRIDPSTGSALDSLELTRVSLKNQMMFLVMDANYYSESSETIYFYLPILFPEPFVRDTLYRADVSGFEPSIKLDFGKRAVSETGSKLVNIRSFFGSDRYLIARYSLEREAKLFVHDLEEQKSYNLNDGFNGEEYSDGEPVLLNPMPNEPNTYYFSAKKVEGGMNEEPNPTLYFVKLKD